MWFDGGKIVSQGLKRGLFRRQLLILIASLLALVGYCADVEVVKVRGRGVGLNQTEALKDAYRDAIENAVGLYVDAEQVVENEDLIKDQILTQSNAYIEKYKVAKATTEQGLIALTIIADVRKLALTRKVKEVMPTQKIAISAQSQNLHAEIVTDFKRKADAVTLLKNELDNLSPVKQLMKVTIGSEKPVFEPVKEDANLVRVWYPINVEVDKTRYYKEFAPRMSRILEQIRIGSPKRFDLSNNLKCVKEYEDYITKKFGASRTGRMGIMTRSSERRRDDGRYTIDQDALKESGLSLNEEYTGVCFLDSIMLGKRHIIYGVSKWFYHQIEDGRYSFDLDDMTLPVFKDHSYRGVYTLEKGKTLPEDCEFYVGIISRGKGHTLSGKLYRLPSECVNEIVAWQEKNVGVWDLDVNREETMVKSMYTLSFVDKSGEEVVGRSIVIRNMDVINLSCNMLEETKSLDRSYTGGKFLWNITPLVGGFAKSYVKWISVDIHKDDVAKIANAMISVEE